MDQIRTGVILAGGENKRFPCLKGFIRIDGTPLIERTLSLLSSLFERVIISTNIPEVYFRFGATLVGDVLPSIGPMSGIYSSLMNAEGDNIFVVACDMPFVNREIISLVCREHLRPSLHSPFDATVPAYNGEPQPLLGVYGKGSLTSLEEGIVRGKTAMRRFLSEINTRFIEESEVRKVDPLGRSFVNINTVADYDRIVNLGEKVSPGLNPL